MSLFGILNIGSSALAAQQAALAVTGNNLSNAADPNYTREVAVSSPGPDSGGSAGLLVGSGVNITSIQRQVDQALNDRIRSSNSDQSSASTQQTWAGQVQSVFNALSGNAVSDQLNTFFKDWSTLANNPAETGQQQAVVQDGQNVAQNLNSLSSNLSGLSSSLDQSVSQGVQQVNQLTTQIATLNQQIVAASNGGAQQPNSLLDQRDTALSQLSNLVNIQTANQPGGSVTVYLGSEAIVDGSNSQALTATTTQNNGHTDSVVNFQTDGSTANITGGSIGGLFQSQQLIDNTSDSVDSLANSLITSVNKVYSSGQGTEGYTTANGTNAVADATQPLDSAAAGLANPPTSGSFNIQVTNIATGQISSYAQIQVTANGTPADTTLNSLAASLNGVAGVQATITNGKLSISTTNPNTQITFNQDTSGVLSALGINTFFSGNSASTIAVNSQAAANPSLLASAKVNPDGSISANGSALAIAALNDTPQAALNGASLSGSYANLIETVGSAASGASSDATAATNVQQTLTAQQQALGGVSTDEEALNMILEQRSYQGAAQLITIVNQMMQSLLAIT